METRVEAEELGGGGLFKRRMLEYLKCGSRGDSACGMKQVMMNPSICCFWMLLYRQI